jgi:uncharacterized protein YidB (DUF937 family)
MSILDGIIGGFIGGELASVVNTLIERQGGLSGLVSNFERGGLGSIAQSWVGKGANAPVSADQLHDILGSDLVQQLVTKTGMSQQDLMSKLSSVLPGVVDKLTPDGILPKG